MEVTCPRTTWMNLPRPIRASFKKMRVKCSISSQQDGISQAQQWSIHEEEEGIMCEACKGRGWLICDFCEGQKTNIKTKNNRIYRRCPTCKAVGNVLCPKCKVYKCVTFPDFFDEA